MKYFFPLILFLFQLEDVNAQMITRSCPLSDFVSITFNPNNWNWSDKYTLEITRQNIARSSKTIVIGMIQNEMNSIIVKFQEGSTRSVGSIENFYQIMLDQVDNIETPPNVRLQEIGISKALNAVYLYKKQPSISGYSFMVPCRAGIIFIDVSESGNNLTLLKAERMAGNVTISSGYQGFTRIYDEIDWRKAFLKGATSVLSPSLPRVKKKH